MQNGTNKLDSRFVLDSHQPTGIYHHLYTLSGSKISPDENPDNEIIQLLL